MSDLRASTKTAVQTGIGLKSLVLALVFDLSGILGLIAYVAPRDAGAQPPAQQQAVAPAQPQQTPAANSGVNATAIPAAAPASTNPSAAPALEEPKPEVPPHAKAILNYNRSPLLPFLKNVEEGRAYGEILQIGKFLNLSENFSQKEKFDIFLKSTGALDLSTPQPSVRLTSFSQNYNIRNASEFLRSFKAALEAEYEAIANEYAAQASLTTPLHIRARIAHLSFFIYMHYVEQFFTQASVWRYKHSIPAKEMNQIIALAEVQVPAVVEAITPAMPDLITLDDWMYRYPNKETIVFQLAFVIESGGFRTYYDYLRQGVLTRKFVDNQKKGVGVYSLRPMRMFEMEKVALMASFSKSRTTRQDSKDQLRFEEESYLKLLKHSSIGDIIDQILFAETALGAKTKVPTKDLGVSCLWDSVLNFSCDGKKTVKIGQLSIFKDKRDFVQIGALTSGAKELEQALTVFKVTGPDAKQLAEISAVIKKEVEARKFAWDPNLVPQIYNDYISKNIEGYNLSFFGVPEVPGAPADENKVRSGALQIWLSSIGDSGQDLTPSGLKARKELLRNVFQRLLAVEIREQWLVGFYGLFKGEVPTAETLAYFEGIGQAQSKALAGPIAEKIFAYENGALTKKNTELQKKIYETFIEKLMKDTAVYAHVASQLRAWDTRSDTVLKSPKTLFIEEFIKVLQASVQSFGLTAEISPIGEQVFEKAVQPYLTSILKSVLSTKFFNSALVKQPNPRLKSLSNTINALLDKVVELWIAGDLGKFEEGTAELFKSKVKVDKITVATGSSVPAANAEKKALAERPIRVRQGSSMLPDGPKAPQLDPNISATVETDYQPDKAYQDKLKQNQLKLKQAFREGEKVSEKIKAEGLNENELKAIYKALQIDQIKTFLSQHPKIPPMEGEPKTKKEAFARAKFLKEHLMIGESKSNVTSYKWLKGYLLDFKRDDLEQVQGQLRSSSMVNLPLSQGYYISRRVIEKTLIVDGVPIEQEVAVVTPLGEDPTAEKVDQRSYAKRASHKLGKWLTGTDVTIADEIDHQLATAMTNKFYGIDGINVKTVIDWVPLTRELNEILSLSLKAAQELLSASLNASLTQDQIKRGVWTGSDPRWRAVYQTSGRVRQNLLEMGWIKEIDPFEGPTGLIDSLRPDHYDVNQRVSLYLRTTARKAYENFLLPSFKILGSLMGLMIAGGVVRLTAVVARWYFFRQASHVLMVRALQFHMGAILRRTTGAGIWRMMSMTQNMGHPLFLSMFTIGLVGTLGDAYFSILGANATENEQAQRAFSASVKDKLGTESLLAINSEQNSRICWAVFGLVLETLFDTAMLKNLVRRINGKYVKDAAKAFLLSDVEEAGKKAFATNTKHTEQAAAEAANRARSADRAAYEAAKVEAETGAGLLQGQPGIRPIQSRWAAFKQRIAGLYKYFFSGELHPDVFQELTLPDLQRILAKRLYLVDWKKLGGPKVWYAMISREYNQVSTLLKLYQDLEAGARPAADLAKEARMLGAAGTSKTGVAGFSEADIKGNIEYLTSRLQMLMALTHGMPSHKIYYENLTKDLQAALKAGNPIDLEKLWLRDYTLDQVLETEFKEFFQNIDPGFLDHIGALFTNHRADLLRIQRRAYPTYGAEMIAEQQWLRESLATGKNGVLNDPHSFFSIPPESLIHMGLVQDTRALRRGEYLAHPPVSPAAGADGVIDGITHSNDLPFDPEILAAWSRSEQTFKKFREFKFESGLDQKTMKAAVAADKARRKARRAADKREAQEAKDAKNWKAKFGQPPPGSNTNTSSGSAGSGGKNIGAAPAA